jgi:hypothetical protein
MGYAVVAGKPSLSITGRLPASGPYGAGEEPTSLSIVGYSGPGFERPRDYRGSAMIALLPHRTGLFSMGAGPEWSGPCTITALEGGQDITCQVSDARGTKATLAATLPPAPDPRRDPGLRWLEVTYAIDGAYQAHATVPVARYANADDRLLEVPLTDGSLLRLIPEGREPDGRQAVLTLRASPAAGVDPMIPSWVGDEATPIFGPCRIGPTGEPHTGQLTCEGADASTTGSVTLEASWRPLP